MLVCSQWVLDSLRAQLARGGADRFDALPRTDAERLGSAVRTIELKSSRFRELSTQHLPLEPKLENGRAYRLCLSAPVAPAAAAGDLSKEENGSEDTRSETDSGHTVWVTLGDTIGADGGIRSALTMRFLQGGRGWIPTPWIGSSAAHAVAQTTVERARQAFITARARHTNVFRFSVRRQRWQKDKPPPERLRDTSFLVPTDCAEDTSAQKALLDDASEFFSLRQWYRSCAHTHFPPEKRSLISKDVSERLLVTTGEGSLTDVGISYTARQAAGKDTSSAN